MITLYDLAAKNHIGTWNVYPWRIRYVLNFKNLPYKTQFIEYPDFENECKKAGIPPYHRKPDGSPYYTSPAIIDDVTGARIADSYKISEYLDEAYPTTPKVIPPGSEALQAAFHDQLAQLMKPLLMLLVPRVPAMVNPQSSEYYMTTRTKFLGKPLDQFELVGEERVQQFNKTKACFNTLDRWLSKSSGPFFMGEKVSFADFVIGSWLQCTKYLLGEDCEEWKDMMSWNDGRWSKLLKDLDEYAGVEK